jgi:hypothetical protein
LVTRHITKNEVEEVIAAPETFYPSQDQPGRTVILGSTATGRRLKVVVSDADGGVITVADRDEYT